MLIAYGESNMDYYRVKDNRVVPITSTPQLY